MMKILPYRLLQSFKFVVYMVLILIRFDQEVVDTIKQVLVIGMVEEVREEPANNCCQLTLSHTYNRLHLLFNHLAERISFLTFLEKIPDKINLLLHARLLILRSVLGLMNAFLELDRVPHRLFKFGAEIYLYEFGLKQFADLIHFI
jgi:hypothetical protein